ncbi:MAG: GvpL/GvpF family gas vesicle protein [Planctomycetes bacterium]|nr:GvpL/GvpF family gas vesicle protein [Planctomycetota bacterium]MBL7184831.1 GvpL/GvpF family gas vesicle protein [Phycisphaerae bacterium]
MDVMTKEGTYIYCIVESDQPRSFGPLGIGGRGDEVYTICFDGIAAVVSNSPVERYSARRENMVAHEKAIEEVMKEHTVLPVRFGTIAEDQGDQGQVRRILEKDHDRFKALLNKMRDKKELNLKAIFNKDAVYQDILEKYEDIRKLKEKLAAIESERTHFQLMQVGEMVEQALEQEKTDHGDEILSVLRPLAEEIKSNDTYGELMIVNAAFLVHKEKEPEFDWEVEGLADKYGEKIRFKYVGTLPPFNFVNLVIETEKY